MSSKDLRKLLKLPSRGGIKNESDHMARSNASASVVDSELDDYMLAVAIFREVNKIRHIRNSDCYFIMKKLGYKK